MLDLFVDSDACPVKAEAAKVASRYSLSLTFVSNSWMRLPDEWKARLEVVDGQFDAADDWIVEHAGKDDIVVTTDILLASRCVKKGVRALSPTGHVFTEANIGNAVATRELMRELREAGTVSGGPAPFQKEDRSRFLQSLDQVIQDVKRGVR